MLTISLQADCTCGISYEGSANNFVDIIASVYTELDCKIACGQNTACKVYTFYSSDRLCILLDDTGLQHPARWVIFTSTASG